MKQNHSRKSSAQYKSQLINKLGVCCLALMTSSLISAANRTDWSWTLEHTAIGDSSISIQNKDNRIRHHQFGCNLSEAVKGKQITGYDLSEDLVDEQAATISTVFTSGYPKGLLVVTCIIGAHSEKIVVIDPSKSGQQVIFRENGDYFVEWKLTSGELYISYDRKTFNKKEQAYGHTTLTKKIITK